MNQNQRFLSLDVFRGLTVACMILVNTPGSWSHVYSPFLHAKWHGCTPTDLVFPFFLFAVGNAMSFAMKKFNTMSNAAVLGKIFKRTALIFAIGLLLNWFPFIKYNAEGNFVMKSLDTLRIFGVLQRIALCYGIGALMVHYLKPKGAFIATCILLLGYWAILWFFGGNDPYSLEGHIGLQIDLAIIGENHMYKGEGIPFEPEGLLSTLPAVGNVVFGYLVGRYVQQNRHAKGMLLKLVMAGSILIVLGILWGTVFPINKKIWTSSYTLYTVGIATLLLSILIYLIEMRNWRWGTYFFEVFGKNPLFIYVMSGVVVKLYFLFRLGEKNENMYSWLYNHVFRPAFGDYPGSLLFGIFHVVLLWLLGWWMDRKKIYIRV
ncbi:heparan-alpha-glucosaminide N-acetyltransferase domain-containing protein [Chitinophaga sp.]|uniref:acyltransferase family protein n=1 Tax=Chitinophaga sp. TaxID=1869181 RepID=UPI0031E3E111